MGTPRKINAILLNIKINRPKLVNMCRYELTTCWQNFMEIYLTSVKISQKVLGGATFFDSHCIYNQKFDLRHTHCASQSTAITYARCYDEIGV